MAVGSVSGIGMEGTTLAVRASGREGQGMASTTDWEKQCVTKSESEVLRDILAAYDRGDVLDGHAGLEAMIQFLRQREEEELVARLAVVMAHILLWKTQAPTVSWEAIIATQREMLTAALQRHGLRFTQERLLADHWREALQKAQQWAMRELGQPPAVPLLTWEDVFETEYRLLRTGAGEA